MLCQAHVYAPPRAVERSKACSYLIPADDACTGMGRCVNRDKCAEWTPSKGKHIFQLPFGEHNQSPILIQRGVREGLATGCGVNTDEHCIRRVHN